MPEPTPEPFEEAGEERPKASKEKLDGVFERARGALVGAEAGKQETFGSFLAALDEAMAGLGAEGPESLLWQQLMIDIYAAGIKQFGPEEMKARYQARFSADDWDFVEQQVWANFFEGLERQI